MLPNAAKMEITYRYQKYHSLAGCNCPSCENVWFVPGDSPEYIPRFCPYCGRGFVAFQRDDGVVRDMRGNPKEAESE